MKAEVFTEEHAEKGNIFRSTYVKATNFIEAYMFKLKHS